MAQNTPLYGTTRSVPETDEENWGQEVTNLHLDQAKGLGGDDGISWLISGKGVHRATVTNNLTLGAAGTITQASAIHIIAGSAPVTLSATTSISNGVVDGQILYLLGHSGITTNTVTILDASNVVLNGTIVFTAHQGLILRWDATLTDWVELFRKF